MWHKSQLLVWAFKGHKPLQWAHGHPPDLLNLQFEDPITLEAGVVIQKAQKPVFVKGEHACPNLWPSPGAITTNLNIYSRASVLLEGEQNKILPGVGSEQHAAQPAPQNPFPFSLLLDTCTHGIMPGKGDTPVPHATKPHLKALKLPGLCEDPLDKPGGVLLRHVYIARKVGAKAVKCVSIEVHKPEGAPLDANPALAPTEDTTSVELIGMAKKAATTEPKALEPRAEGEAWCRLKPLLPPSQKDSGEPESLL